MHTKRVINYRAFKKKFKLYIGYNLLSYSKSIIVVMLSINRSGKDLHLFNNVKL
tara:strand:+ start:272 stop:433 length:162 start_codon:yes stop_codon:yes gene_type:complete